MWYKFLWNLIFSPLFTAQELLIHSLKATIKIRIDVPSELTALSKISITDEKINKNIKTVYLFDHIEESTADSMHIWQRPIQLPFFQVYNDYCIMLAGLSFNRLVTELYDCTHSKYLKHLAFFPSLGLLFNKLSNNTKTALDNLPSFIHGGPPTPKLNQCMVYVTSNQKLVNCFFFFGWRRFQVLRNDNASHPCLWNHLGT